MVMECTVLAIMGIPLKLLHYFGFLKKKKALDITM